MRAIILAAGRGRRLEASNPDGRPKCLLEIGGSSLLRRQLRILHAAGLQQAAQFRPLPLAVSVEIETAPMGSMTRFFRVVANAHAAST